MPVRKHPALEQCDLSGVQSFEIGFRGFCIRGDVFRAGTGISRYEAKIGIVSVNLAACIGHDAFKTNADFLNIHERGKAQAQLANIGCQHRRQRPKIVKGRVHRTYPLAFERGTCDKALRFSG